MISYQCLLSASLLMLCALSATAEPSKKGRKHHPILPDSLIKNIAHVSGKKSSMKMPEKKSTDVEKEKNIYQRNYMKKEVPQVIYSVARGNPSAHTTTGLKRNPAVAAATKALGSEKVQEAIVDKGIEVVGNAIDKQIANIEGAQNKSEAFLNSRIKLDIAPEKGWSNEDMFVPPGYHMSAELENEGEKAETKEQNEPVYAYPAGIGTTMMNGCWGTGYKPGDPCYRSLEVLTACQNMIDGAAFIGVGFDGRGKYSPESRKMSIIQRSCGGRSYYDDFQVPDTMNVHGIYETSSSMLVFSSRREYQSYLQTESGASGSFFGFYAGVKSAYGMSYSSNQQTNLAVFDIDVNRYEIFKDEVKPQDLSRAFLQEFMNLPASYFVPGAPVKFSDFISRWGTHYIKSAKFGGQLEIRKLQNGMSTSSKEEFAVEAEMEYKGLFASGGAYSSTKSGSAEKKEEKFMSTSVQALGGSQRIAAAVTDLYAPTFKSTLVEWLDSINNYPKAFKFVMGSITDLVDFRAADLFPDEPVNWGCEANSQKLVKEKSTGKYYYNRTVDGGIQKTYCEYGSRDELEIKLKQRRSSLKAAIEAYMEEGPISATDVNLLAGEGGCETQDLEGSLAIPAWDDMFNKEEVFHVIFDMDVELRGTRSKIPKSMSRLVKRNFNWWITANENGKFHWFNAFANGGSHSSSNKKISIFGLVLTYASDGSLTLATADYDESRKYISNLEEHLKGKVLARVEWPASTLFSRMTNTTTRLHTPCNVKWSNPFRFDPNEFMQDKCVQFTAFAQGTVYIVFSSIPTKKDTWYSIEISKNGVIVYKGEKILDYTINQNAVSIGSSSLYQSYYACLTESPDNTVVEYGKTQGNVNFGDNYLTTIDRTNPINARFYTFGNGEDDVTIMDIQVTARSTLAQECKGATILDAEGHFCVTKPCHEACDAIAGCRPPAGNTPLPSECYSCKYARNGENCVLKCPSGMTPNKNKKCSDTYDLTFKGAIKEQSSVTVPSTIFAFSICAWIKFPAYKKEYFKKEYGLLGYRGRFPDLTEARLSVKYEKEGVPTLVLRYYYTLDVFLMGSSYVKLEAAQSGISNEWNFVCVTRESSSGNTHLFLHGKMSVTANKLMFPGKTLRKGGNITLAGQTRRTVASIFASEPSATENLPLTITQVNVWDRKLTKDEIAAMSGRPACDGGAGNVLDWEDFKNQLVLSKFTKADNSQCTAISESSF